MADLNIRFSGIENADSSASPEQREEPENLNALKLKHQIDSEKKELDIGLRLVMMLLPSILGFQAIAVGLGWYVEDYTIAAEWWRYTSFFAGIMSTFIWNRQKGRRN